MAKKKETKYEVLTTCYHNTRLFREGEIVSRSQLGPGAVPKHFVELVENPEYIPASQVKTETSEE